MHFLRAGRGCRQILTPKGQNLGQCRKNCQIWRASPVHDFGQSCKLGKRRGNGPLSMLSREWTNRDRVEKYGAGPRTLRDDHPIASDKNICIHHVQCLTKAVEPLNTSQLWWCLQVAEFSPIQVETSPSRQSRATFGLARANFGRNHSTLLQTGRRFGEVGRSWLESGRYQHGSGRSRHKQRRIATPMCFMQGRAEHAGRRTSDGL